jgi:hypothetical protein
VSTSGESVRRRAIELIRASYEAAARVRALNLTRLNRARPPSMRYATKNHLIREYLSAAGAVSTFAVNLGLITPEEAAQLIRDFQSAHPELHQGDEEQWWDINRSNVTSDKSSEDGAKDGAPSESP